MELKLCLLNLKQLLLFNFMADGGNGLTLGVAAIFNRTTELGYLHDVSAIIADKLKYI
jgi:hypothetical protein